MVTKVHDLLYQWYQKNGRHELPWRLTNDPYKVYVSEIMLQQTQVKTVLERFYFPFLEAFPTLADLAAADLDEVLKKWEGLGYYTRARNLHVSARRAQTHLPFTVHELEQLPGIGKSTAHAIAAFAYKTPVPILDANVKRILCRYYGLKQPNDKTLWEYAYRLFDAKHPFEYNQALMDIGATICTAKSVTCKHCPLRSTCKATHDDPLAYGYRRHTSKVPIKKRAITVYAQNGRYGLMQRTGRFLYGLWGFVETQSVPKHAQKLGTIIQKYSHFHLHADIYLCHDTHENLEWFTPKEINALALSRADHKVLALL